MTENDIGTLILGSAIEVHRQLGPGLFESVYEVVLAAELSAHGLVVKRQVPISIVYKAMSFDDAFHADLLVEDKVIVELKSIEQINNVHKKQLQTYLRLTGLKLGYLLNFGTDLMKNGIFRAVNNLEEPEFQSLSPLSASARTRPLCFRHKIPREKYPRWPCTPTFATPPASP